MDECAVDNDGCEGSCINTLGSFVCSCGPGYILNGNGLTCDGMCVYGYANKKRGGGGLSFFSIIVIITLLDINECAVDNGGCEHNCTNTLGSSVCSCGPGYILNGNGLTCDGMCVYGYAKKGGGGGGGGGGWGAVFLFHNYNHNIINTARYQ